MSTIDTVDQIDPVDLSDYKTAHGAAKRAYKQLRALAEAQGQNPDSEVSFYTPEESRRYRDMHPDGADCYTVSWEAGPYEWAPAVTGGESIYWNEWGGSFTPEITGILDGDGWGVECYYSFDLQFFNE